MIDSGGISEIVPWAVQRAFFGLLPQGAYGDFSATPRVTDTKSQRPGWALATISDVTLLSKAFEDAVAIGCDGRTSDCDGRAGSEIRGSSIDQVFGRQDWNGIFLSFLLFSPWLSIFVTLQLLFELLELFVVGFFA